MPRISPERLAEMRTIAVMPGGLPSKPRVREWSDPVSGRMKATTDELGNTVTQHSRGDRQDVHINATPVQAKAGLELKG